MAQLYTTIEGVVENVTPGNIVIQNLRDNLPDRYLLAPCFDARGIERACTIRGFADINGAARSDSGTSELRGALVFAEVILPDGAVTFGSLEKRIRRDEA